MSNVEYQFLTDVPAVFRGNTLYDMAFTVNYENGDPVIPKTVCAQILNSFNKPLFTWTPVIDPITGRVTLGTVVDSGMIRAGAHRYAVNYTLEDGRNYLFFGGAITLEEGKPLCQ